MGGSDHAANIIPQSPNSNTGQADALGQYGVMRRPLMNWKTAELTIRNLCGRLFPTDTVQVMMRCGVCAVRCALLCLSLTSGVGRLISLWVGCEYYRYY